MVVWDLATVSKSSLYTSRPTLAPFAKLTAVDPEIEFAPAKSVLAEATLKLPREISSPVGITIRENQIWINDHGSSQFVLFWFEIP